MAAVEEVAPFERVGTEFVNHYYRTFQANRVGLKDLYAAESMLTWEGKKHKGQEQILTALLELKFERVEHAIVKADCQPGLSDSILVVVIGDIKIDDSPPLKFSQAFSLVPTPAGGYIILNDVFRLCIG